MRRALALAGRAQGRTWPNPMVGALVVNPEGQVVGEGFHLRAGLPHAEPIALRQAGPLACGACLYVTLEPCCHHGRTPPCLDVVLASGVKRIVISMADPNPKMSGRSLERLREAGVEVVCGVLAQDSARLNAPFIKRMRTGLPWVTWKYAMTMDGRIATRTGSSQWITSPRLRTRVHTLRLASDAIITGIGTVLADDPALTCRHPKAEPTDQPLRVVVDSQSVLLGKSQLVATARTAPLLVATTTKALPDKVQALRKAGVEVLVFPPTEAGRVPLGELLKVLGGREYTRVLLECGPQLATGFWEGGHIDEVVAHLAPKFAGGACAPGPLVGHGVELMAQSTSLYDVNWDIVGDEAVMTGVVRPMLYSSHDLPLD